MADRSKSTPDDSWAPPRLRAVPPDADLTPNLSEDWKEENLARLRKLDDIEGFEACYALRLDPPARSALVGDSAAVSPAQLQMIAIALSLNDMEHVVFTRTSVQVIAQVTQQGSNTACVLIINRDEGNSALARAKLQDICASWT